MADTRITETDDDDGSGMIDVLRDIYGEDEHADYDSEFERYDIPENNNENNHSETHSRLFLYRSCKYPAYCEENDQSITQQEIEKIFLRLKDFFGFQSGSMKNMLDHFMVQLDSRSSRLTCKEALVTLHADYIGGDNANYRKWYFSAMLDVDGLDDLTLSKTEELTEEQKRTIYKLSTTLENRSSDEILTTEIIRNDLKHKNFKEIEYSWKLMNNSLTPEQLVEQIALYLLIWGEANQIRFTPETLCFIYKLAYDKYKSKKLSENIETVADGNFLENVINPLYAFIKMETYKKYDGKFMKRDRDHKKVIGYDDVNQLFWYKKGLKRILVKENNRKSRLLDYEKGQRYDKLPNVVWKKAFYKTYKESRTWMHLFTNFNRIWIIHLSTFWYYTIFNSPTLYTPKYVQTLDNKPLPQVTFSILSLGSSIACLIQFIATISEWFFVPQKWPGAQNLSVRFFLLLVIFFVNVAPSYYILVHVPIDTYSKSAHILSIVQFIISILTFTFFASRPLGALFGSYLNNSSSHIGKYYASNEFTAAFPKLAPADKTSSYILWVVIFICKFTESYYFLTLSIKDPVRVLSIMRMTRCVGEIYYGNLICTYQPLVVLVLMYIIDLILFFLDTYLWYIICNCVFSCVSSYKAGFSVLSPWKDQYGSLPERIYTKILATAEIEVKYKPKILISQIWNSIVITMYKEHILTLPYVERLLYRQIESETEGKMALKEPALFITKGEGKNDMGLAYVPKNSEAERRLSFFSRSLASSMSDPIPVEHMPTFSVLVPHYSEKIILTLKEVIRGSDDHSKVSLLEYLKILYPLEWDCFVNDTRIIAGQKLEEERKKQNESYFYNYVSTEKESIENPYWSKVLDKPFLLVGYKSEIPEFTLRTRIWASLRSQTLYRTISGFMNYAKALKLLYRVENPELITRAVENGTDFEKDIETMAFRKFNMMVSMQRYQEFNTDEIESTDFLLRAYPYLKIAYLEKVPCESQNEWDDSYKYYSCLIDGKSEIDSNGRRIPYYKIQLSGNPILGDGKADNQNHALIFYRGEYIQVIDANQDNYLEECLKIRSVLSEFEELNGLNVNPYIPDSKQETKIPVAIIGAREYIFSENTGVLGDVAAGKEQTFGTLFARTLAIIGGKLHYGHPDFLNSIFMTTRGGISKAQKGLHLNEDIYAGMTAVCRGGRIKHCDYYQCGKGRDLGFGSILNFTTKIGAGMGEQLLSREYYYMGTQLPLDIFLSFYYAHAGFHINNLLIILSVNLFMCVVVNLGALNHESIKCIYNKDVPITDIQIPLGCYNIQPVLDWVTRFVLSIFICFFIAFLPLILQEFTERGLWKVITRLTSHFLSLSPVFEVFACQIYSTSLTSNLAFGGAKYISSGRGFATTRVPFWEQYSKFATTSIYSGAYLFLTLLFASLTMWQPALLWFWISSVSLCLAPFIFNPHQFSFTDFFVDYREYIKWLIRGNDNFDSRSWISFARQSRSRFTGFRKGKTKPTYKNIQKPSVSNLFYSEVLSSLFYALSSFLGYTFVNAQNGVKEVKATNSVLRLAVIAGLPIALDTIIVSVLVTFSIFCGPVARCCYSKKPRIGGYIAALAHGLSVICHIACWELLYFLESWNFPRALMGLICGISTQNIIFQFVIVLFLNREERHNHVNKAWWDGNWLEAQTDTFKGILFFREWAVKIVELSRFSLDFILGHFILFIQTPILFLPYIDKWHSLMLFWFTPTKDSLAPSISSKRKLRRRRIVMRYSLLYFLIMITCLTSIIVAPFTASYIPNPERYLPKFFNGIVQPNYQNNNDTGENAPTTVLRNTPTLAPIKTMF
ncbi:hypothetical protein DASC09_008230 [Saccharomycopsis crataegensis]|uniref:1,3-beta-glucan synthase n=1 Tax=Saccharomycopsis crataegensis TaxID=43959 RepID=A0AAV5QF93_9ASCO|nr:hypothetical protein DASC09_008230 [Saccharomycopsis crataegensis]